MGFAQTWANVHCILCGRLRCTEFTLKRRWRLCKRALLFNASPFNHHFESFDVFISRWGLEWYTETSRSKLVNHKAFWRCREKWYYLKVTAKHIFLVPTHCLVLCILRWIFCGCTRSRPCRPFRTLYSFCLLWGLQVCNLNEMSPLTRYSSHAESLPRRSWRRCSFQLHSSQLLASWCFWKWLQLPSGLQFKSIIAHESTHLLLTEINVYIKKTYLLGTLPFGQAWLGGRTALVQIHCMCAPICRKWTQVKGH